MLVTGWYRKYINGVFFTNRGIICLFSCLVLTSSCKSRRSKPKEDHLPKSLMQKVLLDVNIAEAYSTMVKDTANKIVGKNFDSLAVYYKSILSHHKVSVEQFTNSLEWYKQHPEEMDSIYFKMIPLAENIKVTPAKK